MSRIGERVAVTAIISAFALATGEAAAQQRYGWAVSGSATNPCVNWGNFPPGVATLHLWYVYNSPDGFSAADISAVQNPSGAVDILAFTTANGFLNAGSPTNLLLAIGGCPDGPMLAGSWLLAVVLPQFEFCLGGVNGSLDCGLNPVVFPNDHLGFGNNLQASCCAGFDYLYCGGCGTVSVEDNTWGGIKSQYR